MGQYCFAGWFLSSSSFSVNKIILKNVLGYVKLNPFTENDDVLFCLHFTSIYIAVNKFLLLS